MVTMPRRKKEICPQCSNNIKCSESRLIRDTCGHKKCRLCLVKELKGCLACAAKGKLQKDRKSQEHYNQGNTTTAEAPYVSPDTSNDVNTCIITTNIKSVKKTAVPATVENEVSIKPNSVSKPARKKFAIENHIEVLLGTPQQYQCTICNKTISKMSLRYHNYCASKQKPFTCETCGKGFVTKSHYEYHLKIHTGDLPYVCTVCGKRFKERGKLSRHTKLHLDDRPFVCQECGKTFTNVESLKSHQRTHRGEKPHVCHICSKAFIEHSNYLKHVAFHRGERLHMCDICGKTFALKRSLVTHTLMIHDRERNHVCTQCNRKFTLKRDLKRHEMVHSVVRPHSCTLCNIGFRRKDNLERHMKNTHPETRMVIVGSGKQKPIEICKSPSDTMEQRNEDNAEDTDELIIDEPPTPPSPIPPSQTINAETLRSVQKISDEQSKLTNKQRGNVLSEINHITHQKDVANTTNYLQPGVSDNYSPINHSNHLMSASLTVEVQCYENTHNMQKTTDGSPTSHFVHQETNQTGTLTICPPKKNIEYYRAVPVINRSSNVTNNCSNDINCQTISTNDQHDIVRRVEGTNCVPTITRACEYMPGSVITRNLQQTIPTILKPISRDDSYQTLNLLPCMGKNSHSDQPSLRRLLHDVKCSDGSDILNLTNDIIENKKTLFPDDLRQLSSVKFDKPNDIEAQFYPPKHSNTYIPETSVQSRVNEYPSNSTEDYFNHDYNRKVTGAETETLFSSTHFRQNYTSLNYDLIPPSYTGYDDNIGQSLSRYSDVGPPTDLVTRYSTDINKSQVENYVYGTKHMDSGGRLKHFADMMHSEGVSCTQGVGQPVIVGSKKISNNVICSSFDN